MRVCDLGKKLNLLYKESRELAFGIRIYADEIFNLSGLHNEVYGDDLKVVIDGDLYEFGDILTVYRDNKEVWAVCLRYNDLRDTIIFRGGKLRWRLRDIVNTVLNIDEGIELEVSYENCNGVVLFRIYRKDDLVYNTKLYVLLDDTGIMLIRPGIAGMLVSINKCSDGNELVMETNIFSYTIKFNRVVDIGNGDVISCYAKHKYRNKDKVNCMLKDMFERVMRFMDIEIYEVEEFDKILKAD